MTNKHYNWMTPEKADNEIERDAYVWFILTDNPSVVRGGVKHFLGVEDYEGLFTNDYVDRICRAIVPEVPNE